MDRTGVGTVCLWLWALIFVVNGQNYVNVAPGKTYSQSSTYHEQGSASNAANGNTDGKFNSSNCIHTNDNNEQYPWYQVDLGKAFPVYNIDLWARTNIVERVYPFIITVDDQTCVNKTDIPSEDNNRHATVTCSAIMSGQKVRITRQGRSDENRYERNFNLCEMQIFVCADGWYGKQCSSPCSSLCQNNVCDRQSGQCTECVDRYYKNNDGTCVACSSNCLNQMCDKTTGVCTECVDTYYKNSSGTCAACSSYCLNPLCDKTTGVCTGCVTGWHGDKCSLPCPTGCLNACDQQSAKCFSCKDGWHGDQCSLPCPTGCLNACDQQSEKCVSCKDGWYGEKCPIRCSEGCMNKQCQRLSGKCSPCKDGWYGDQCSLPCPTGCLKACDQQSAKCSPCKDGYTGSNCSECQDGYYNNGSMCSQCSSSCRSGMCNKSNGTCKGCIDGRYGDMCTTECQTANCLQCDQKTGSVCAGCAAHLQPPACIDCLDEYYKQPNVSGCSRCSGSCKSGTVCNKTTGYCALCPPDMQGNYCDQQRAKNGDDDTGVIVGAVIATIIAILIVVIIVIFVMRRRKHATKMSSPDSEMSSAAQNGRDRGRREEGTGHPGSSTLSFEPVLLPDDKKDTTPKPPVKPMATPAVKPQPAQTGGNIYENVALPQQSAASSSTPTATNPKGTPSNALRPLSAPMTDDEELDSGWHGEEQIYSNDPSYTNNIRLDQLQETIVDSLKDSKIADEFQFMTGFKQLPVTNANRQENYYKNRFKTIIPYDNNRVVLEQVDDDDASDYVNASFIKGYKTDKAYIAAQGPKENTKDDFWRMIWQEGVTDIVMLTNLKEGNKPKCHKYWPAKGKSLNTGHVEITGHDEEKRAHFIIRTFYVGKPQSKEKRQVRQYHYIKWMDHEVPATTPLVDFWRYVRARAPRTPTAPPLLVHCSAGVGRTGTYIALDILIDQSQQEQEISLYSTVDKLRNYRCHMVQNKGQYEFLHEAVLEAYMSGDSRQKTSSFDNVFPLTIHHDKPHPRIDTEYKKLCQMRTCLTHPSHKAANLVENRAKNRNPNALPDDKHLVYITEHTKERNQYINAVYMPTFLSSRGSILTQLPLADTVIDLWRLVDSWDVSTIVSIGYVDDQEGRCRYWPKALQGTLKCGAYTISTKSKTSLGETLRSFTVELKKESQSRELRVLHFEGWTGEVADNIPDLISLLDTLHTAHKQSTENPVIIQCIDGVAKSGALCALWDVISRVMNDDDIDIYLAVRQVHNVRPEAIPSVVQYRFLYKVVQQYRLSHSVYANI